MTKIKLKLLLLSNGKTITIIKRPRKKLNTTEKPKHITATSNDNLPRSVYDNIMF